VIQPIRAALLLDLLAIVTLQRYQSATRHLHVVWHSGLGGQQKSQREAGF
jgi:hypothetical protein